MTDTEQLADCFRDIVTGLNTMIEAQKLQSRMLEQILLILTAEPAGPSPMAEALQALVAICHEIQAGTEHIETNVDIAVPLIRELAEALLRPRS